MSESARITGLSARVLTGDPWHAANIRDLLQDVSAADAHAHPVPGAHSIWEIVLHVTGWATEIRARLGTAKAGVPGVGDWPPVGRPTTARWDAARAALFAAYDALEAAIAKLSDADLKRGVKDLRTSSGIGMSRYLTSHGAIHHAVYHAGQIALLKRVAPASALRAPARQAP